MGGGWRERWGRGGCGCVEGGLTRKVGWCGAGGVVGWGGGEEEGG